MNISPLKKSLLVSVTAALLFAMPSHGEIYKYVDKYGKVHYGDRKLSDEHKPIIYTWKGWHEVQYYDDYKKNRDLFTPYIRRAASKYELPEKLIHAVIQTESYYNPVAESHAGAVGLMQLMPATAKRLGVTNRKDPRQSIDGGSKYLQILLKLFNNNMTLAIAAYNAGEGAVKKYGYKIPPYPETQNYVRKVLALYHK